MIVIIDYGVGNLTSVQKMLVKSGCDNCVISGSKTDIQNASKLILPGVGRFDFGMKKLNNSGFLETLNKKVLEDKTPILGICLGAQLMTRGSEEGEENGLGWIEGDTVKFDTKSFKQTLKIPNMGWLDVDCLKDHPLLAKLETNSRFYFVHSYHLQCDEEREVAVITNYGYKYAAGFIKGNIFGMQFHPEKSHKYGLQLMKNFVSL